MSGYRCTKVINWYGRTQEKPDLPLKTDLFSYKIITMPADTQRLIDYREHFADHEVR